MQHWHIVPLIILTHSQTGQYHTMREKPVAIITVFETIMLTFRFDFKLNIIYICKHLHSIMRHAKKTDHYTNVGRDDANYVQTHFGAYFCENNTSGWKVNYYVRFDRIFA